MHGLAKRPVVPLVWISPPVVIVQNPGGFIECIWIWRISSAWRSGQNGECGVELAGFPNSPERVEKPNVLPLYFDRLNRDLTIQNLTALLLSTTQLV